MKKNILILVCLCFMAKLSIGQTADTKSKNRELIQFSGVVVSSDSLQPIPFASVFIQTIRRGTMTDYYGFFSFVAMKGDTINFQYIGYKPASYIIPDSLKEDRYSLIQVLKRDTILLKEALVYPWPSKEEFKRAFLDLKIPQDDYQRALRNLELAEVKAVQDQVPFDGSMNYKLAMQQQQSRLYSSGQFPTNNLFNPLAWAAFIKAWQDGAFKKKDDK